MAENNENEVIVVPAEEADPVETPIEGEEIVDEAPEAQTQAQPQAQTQAQPEAQKESWLKKWMKFAAYAVVVGIIFCLILIAAGYFFERLSERVVNPPAVVETEVVEKPVANPVVDSVTKLTEEEVKAIDTKKAEAEIKVPEVKPATDEKVSDPAEVVEKPEITNSDFDPYDFVPEGYEPQFIDRFSRVWHHYRIEVNEAGEHDQAALVVTKDLDNLLISRVVPDDHLIDAWCLAPDSDEKINILDDLAMVEVPKGGTGDSTLDEWLASNEVNVEDGELLVQNSKVIYVKGPVQAGFACYFHIEDDEALGVNVGLDILTGGQMPATRVVEISPQ